MSINDITGDSLRSRPATKAYTDNFDSVFRKPKTYSDEKVLNWKWVNQQEEPTVPLWLPTDTLGEPVLTTREPLELTSVEFTNEDWNEGRMDTIGSNGNEGLHYLH